MPEKGALGKANPPATPPDKTVLVASQFVAFIRPNHREAALLSCGEEEGERLRSWSKTAIWRRARGILGDPRKNR